MKLLKRTEIDDGKWDALIAGSTAETLYPYTWYLDTVADNWSAIVVDDYSFVMPVVWRKKAGIKYIYQPLYAQQLGVFGRDYVAPALILQMLKLLYRKFKFAGMNLNVKNLVGEEKGIRVYDKCNYVLKLDQDYAAQYRAYNSNTRRNIRKAGEFNAQLDKNIPVEELVELKRENDMIKRSRADYSWLVRLFETIKQRDAGIIYAIRSGPEVSAAAFFAFSKSRAIYLLSASSAEGKDNRGMFRIVDAFIRDHAGSGLILDFEGSNIPSVARFFGGFGAQPELYQYVGFSRLPLTLKKLRV